MTRHSDSPLAPRLDPAERGRRLMVVGYVEKLAEAMATELYVRACDERLVSDCRSLLADAFDADQMELIDAALSRSTGEGVLPRRTTLLERLLSVAFGRGHEHDSEEGDGTYGPVRYFDGAGCIRAICENIRAHDGHFVPPSLDQVREEERSGDA